MMYENKKTRGFTLLETLVAVAVIAIAITGPFVVVQGVLQTSYTARDQLIAAALAQEGMEYVRSIRDANFLDNYHHTDTLTWLNGLDGTNGPSCYASEGGNLCIVDAGQQTVAACSAADCSTQPLYLSGSNLYTQVPDNNTLTKYTRTVELKTINANETRVIVTVSWSSHGAHSLTIVENLQNWL